jgi:hypothetical protein
MAKKAARGEKSQAIRDFLKANPKAKASEVVTALAQKGITVSGPMVYTLKARNRMGKRRKQARSSGQTIGLSISSLLAAKRLVDEVGGIDQAREALDGLAKLR